MNPSNPESFTGGNGGAFRPENLGPRVEQEPNTPNIELAPTPQETKQAAQGSPVVLPILPTPILPDPLDQTTSSTPIAAADDDLIEKEWVQKAKNIVAQTRNDPYMQEAEISKLQADYIKKRYGKEVKLAGDS
jgi:hypothetical protein